MWPSFLEGLQKRGIPKGFGLDYDYRKFSELEEDNTTYLKMQLWGGQDTEDLYRLLKEHPRYGDKTVLSKVRFKEWGDEAGNDLFALQDIKFNGKCTVRGTDFSTHSSTLAYARSTYKEQIEKIENSYALRWREIQRGSGVVLDGYPLHFIPKNFTLPVEKFCERVLDGTAPFRLVGFYSVTGRHSAVAEVVDMHTGGEFSLEIYPDMMSIYLPAKTCGNSIARLYTNLQHFFNANFSVEVDDGSTIF